MSDNSEDSGSGSWKGKAVVGSSDEPLTVSRSMSRAVRETLNASNPDKENSTSSSNVTTNHFIPGSSDACAVGNSLPRNPSNPFRLIATQPSSSNIATSSLRPVTTNFNLNNQAPSFMPHNWINSRPFSSYSYPANQQWVFGSPNSLINSNTYLHLPYSLLMQISPFYQNNHRVQPQMFTMSSMMVPVYTESLHPQNSLFLGYTRIYLTGPTSAFTFGIDLAGVQYSLPLQYHPSLYTAGLAYGNMAFTPSLYPAYMPWGNHFNLNNMGFSQSPWPHYSTWGSEVTVRYDSVHFNPISHDMLHQTLANLNMIDDQPNVGARNDEFHDMRLDIDNWTYEELLALEDRIGSIGTGLTEEEMSSMRTYTTVHIGVVLESCSICQEVYTVGDEIGALDCDHKFHNSCIQIWLARKNRCPICNRTALGGINSSE